MCINEMNVVLYAAKHYNHKAYTNMHTILYLFVYVYLIFDI